MGSLEGSFFFFELDMLRHFYGQLATSLDLSLNLQERCFFIWLGCQTKMGRLVFLFYLKRLWSKKTLLRLLVSGWRRFEGRLLYRLLVLLVRIVEVIPLVDERGDARLDEEGHIFFQTCRRFLALNLERQLSLEQVCSSFELVQNIFTCRFFGRPSRRLCLRILRIRLTKSWTDLLVVNLRGHIHEEVVRWYCISFIP